MAHLTPAVATSSGAEASFQSLGIDIGTDVQSHDVTTTNEEAPGRPRSPIETLPIELLRQIFSHCTDASDLSSSRHLPPLNLIRVCRLWRDIALAHGYLWSHFTITASRLYIFPPMFVIQDWLDRSQPYPLSLRITHRQNSSRRGRRISILDLGKAITAFSVLDTCIQRCRILSFDDRIIYSPHTGDSGVHKGLLKRAEVLEDLSVTMIPYDASPSPLIAGFFESVTSEDVPRLRTLQWTEPIPSNTSIPPLYSTLATNFIGTQLTTVVMNSVSDTDSCLRFMQTCPSLRECRLQFNLRATEAYWDVEQFIRLNNLRYLECSGHLPPAGIVIDQLILPSLSNLVLCSRSEDTAFDGVLTPLLHRSSPPLEVLVLRQVNILNADLINSLRAVSSTLETLSISSKPPLLPESLEELALLDNEGQPTLCPKLKKLSLHNCFVSLVSGISILAEHRLSSALQYCQPLCLKITMSNDTFLGCPELHEYFDRLREWVIESGGQCPYKANQPSVFTFEVHTIRI
ncbi:hypothetical protein HGRIS_013477 [Hohenbuehelia grisea]|uniref:F-box domain-containing protein n=1 Tax=Hohenbuehelia grisea TaxID=104357 RepID=A0ABR3IVH5_9AGAR